MSGDDKDLLQRAKDALKNALAELESESRGSTRSTESTGGTNNTRSSGQSVTDDFR